MSTNDFSPIKSLISSLRDILSLAIGEDSDIKPCVRVRLESYDTALAQQQALIERTETGFKAECSESLRALELIDASATMLLEDAEDLIREIDTITTPDGGTSHWC
jgi:hypothetical protein